MKKTFIFLFALLASMSFAKKPKNIRLVMVSPISSETPVYENDSIRFEFEWRDYKNYGIYIKIINSKTSRIYVEWENARVQNERLCFGDDNIITYKQKREDEVIHASSYSRKFVGRKSDFTGRDTQIFPMSKVKETGESECREIILPIKHEDKTTDYRFALKIIGDIK